jgi:hypothetical protein
MKTLALAAALALVTSGCLVVPPRSSRAAVKSDRGGGKPCPPGHLWSDGQCHSKGKGHDR